jgi:hypothetical protein
MADSPTNLVQWGGVGGTTTTLADVESIVVQMGVDQDTATCEVVTSALQAVDKQERLTISAGYSGSNTLIFNGLVSGRSGRLSSRNFALKGQCYMARLRHPWGNGEFTYTSQLASAIVVNLIEKSGIDPSLHSVDVSTWLVATLEDLLLRDGTADISGSGVADVPLSIIREMDHVELCWTATRGNGAIYRKLIALTTPYATYSEGSPVREIEWSDDVEGIVNKVLVKGLQFSGIGVEDEFSATNAYLPSPVEYNTETVQSNLIEDDASLTALDVATNYVTLYNHPPEFVTLTLDGDPDLQIGYTVTVDCSFLGINKDYFVKSIEHRITSNDFVTTAQCMALD